MSTKKSDEKNVLKENTGFLHVTTEKSNENAPDYFGSIDVAGTVYKLAGWKKPVEDNGSFISLNLDDESLTPEEAKAIRQENMDAFKKAKKKKENKDQFVMIEGTGSLHRSKPEEKEDFFGTLMIDAKKVYVKGFASETKKKLPVIRLEVSDGTRTKEQRTALADSFM